MDTRRHSKALLLLSLAASVALGAAPAAAAARPSVVVVMTDDQTVADLAAMPKTRRFVGQAGVSFRNAYVSYPVCCPSRATYLTGQYAHNHGVMGIYPPTGGYGRFDKHDSLPVWMRRGGYRTAHLGKFLNGYGDQEPADVPPGWSDWHATVDYSTYAMWGYTINHDGRMRTYGSALSRDPRLYQTDVLTRRAVSIIRDAGDAPLFLSVAYLAPHHEARRIQKASGRLVRPAPRHEGAFASSVPARPASFNERDMSDKPRFLRRRTRRFGDDDIATLVRDARDRRASLLAVDDGVARIVGALRRAGRLDDTYVLFTSDNGYMQGEHRVRAGKMLPYDPSTRVPLLLRGPGIPRGAVSDELVANVDLAPTLLDVAEASAGKELDGRSLLPFAREPGRTTRRAILHETGGKRLIGPRGQDQGDAPGGVVARVLTYRAVRTARWLYVAYRDGSKELYDMRRDPDQLDSLHHSRAHARIRRVLRRELNRLATCAGAGCTRTAPRWTVRRGLEGGDSVSS